MGEALNGVILKICGKRKGGGYKNSDAVEKTITYVLRENARKKDDLWGSIGTFAKTGDGMIRDFYKLKRLYGKEGGTQVKHLVLSWGRRPEIPRKKYGIRMDIIWPGWIRMAAGKINRLIAVNNCRRTCFPCCSETHCEALMQGNLFRLADNR